MRRGVNLSSWFANAPRQPLAPQDFRQIKEMGFDHVRLPVNPELVGFSLDRDVTEQTLSLDPVDAAIQGLIDAGLDVILDVHPEAAFMRRLEESRLAEDRFLALWQRLSDHYKNFPATRLVYELLNEPQYYDKARRYNNFINRVARAVREKEPDRFLIINPSGNLSPKPVEGLKALKLLRDPKVIYAPHYYQPYIITHQGMPSGFEKEQIPHFRSVPYPSSLVNAEDARKSLSPRANPKEAMKELDAYVKEDWGYDRILSDLAPLALWARDNRVRVIVPEFGVLRKNIDPQSRYRWISDVRKALESLGLGWTYWDYTDGFGIMALVGETATDPDGTIKFKNPADPNNRRIEETDALLALGLLRNEEPVEEAPALPLEEDRE